jgi:hypothetical protein
MRRPCRDCRKRHLLAVVGGGEFDRSSVARRQLLGLAVGAAPPHRADGVDDVPDGPHHRDGETGCALVIELGALRVETRLVVSPTNLEAFAEGLEGVLSTSSQP